MSQIQWSHFTTGKIEQSSPNEVRIPVLLDMGSNENPPQEFPDRYDW